MVPTRLSTENVYSHTGATALSSDLHSCTLNTDSSFNTVTGEPALYARLTVQVSNVIHIPFSTLLIQRIRQSLGFFMNFRNNVIL
jgi:hypothetical protein